MRRTTDLRRMCPPVGRPCFLWLVRFRIPVGNGFHDAVCRYFEAAWKIVESTRDFCRCSTQSLCQSAFDNSTNRTKTKLWRNVWTSSECSSIKALSPGSFVAIDSLSHYKIHHGESHVSAIVRYLVLSVNYAWRTNHTSWLGWTFAISLFTELVIS